MRVMDNEQITLEEFLLAFPAFAGYDVFNAKESTNDNQTNN